MVRCSSGFAAGGATASLVGVDSGGVSVPVGSGGFSVAGGSGAAAGTAGSGATGASGGAAGDAPHAANATDDETTPNSVTTRERSIGARR